MKKVLAVIAFLAPALLGPAVRAGAQDAKLPVFYLRYSGGLGSEELEEDEIIDEEEEDEAEDEESEE